MIKFYLSFFIDNFNSCNREKTFTFWINDSLKNIVNSILFKINGKFPKSFSYNSDLFLCKIDTNNYEYFN